MNEIFLFRFTFNQFYNDRLVIWTSLVKARVDQSSSDDSSRIIFILEKATLSRDVYESHKASRATSRNQVFTAWNTDPFAVLDFTQISNRFTLWTICISILLR